FAFVEYEDRRDAEDAQRALDGYRLGGAELQVEFAKHGKREDDGSGCYRCGRRGHFQRECPMGGGRGRGGNFDSRRSRDHYEPRRDERRGRDRDRDRRSRSRDRDTRRYRERSRSRTRSPDREERNGRGRDRDRDRDYRRISPSPVRRSLSRDSGAN
ncbi:Serine/arginine-rich splicing factor 1, partial [Dispira simplex]